MLNYCVKTFAVPPSRIELIKGESQRTKKVKISERKTVQSDELESFIKSTPEIGKNIRRVARGTDMKVASIKISAYKPAL